MARGLNSGTVRHRHQQHHHQQINPQIQDVNIQPPIRQPDIARQHTWCTHLKGSLLLLFFVVGTLTAYYFVGNLLETQRIERQREHEMEMERIRLDREQNITLMKEDRKLRYELELKKLEEQRKKDLAETEMKQKHQQQILEEKTRKEIEVKKLEEQTKKELAEKEMKLEHERKLKHLELTAVKELEMEKEKEFLRLQKELEVKKIDARTEIYKKAFEAKKVVKTTKYLGGLITTQHEEIESPLKDSHSIHMIQESLEPHLGIVHQTQTNPKNSNMDEL